MTFTLGQSVVLLRASRSRSARQRADHLIDMRQAFGADKDQLRSYLRELLE